LVDLRDDQAAGLRRMFAPRSAALTTFFGEPRIATQVLSGCARAIASRGLRVLVIDEQRGPRNAISALGHVAQVLLGDVTQEQATVAVAPGNQALAAGRMDAAATASPAFAGTWRRLLSQYDRLLVNASAGNRLSAFVRAADSAVFALGHQPARVTDAYALIKRVVGHAPGIVPYVIAAAPETASAQHILSNLECVAARHLPTRLMVVGTVLTGTPARGLEQCCAQVVGALLQTTDAGLGRGGPRRAASAADPHALDLQGPERSAAAGGRTNRIATSFL
jgi:hypothetical protein